MPGIAGIITTNPDAAAVSRELGRMISCMLHEPFYACGTYVAPEIGAYVGWVTHKGSYSDCNPIIDSTGQLVLIFSGEHFGELPSSSTSIARDATELLDEYQRWGDDFLPRLNGWFSGVLIDRRRERTTLFVDRFGMHRVYYAGSGDWFTFASEAKSVLALRPECRALDAEALGQFVTFGSVFQDRTLFRDVFLLPAAAAWTFSRSPQPKKRIYFNHKDWEAQAADSEDAYYEDLRETISSVVPRYSAGPQEVGVSLTGGLDTRIIMAAAPRDGARLPTYTYGGSSRECFDVRTAAEVARICHRPHHVISLGQDFFSDFSDLAERTVWLTDGSLEISGAHELYFSQRARQIAVVRLTGNYGSEVLRGVSTFKPGRPSEDLYADDLRPYVDEALRVHAELRTRHDVSFASLAEIPWHLYGRLAVAQTQLTLRSPYMDNALVGLAYRVPPQLRNASELSLRLISDLNPALGDLETDMGLRRAGASFWSLPRRLKRYLLFKAEWYYNLGMTDWLAHGDRLVLKRLEPLFLGTHKIDHIRVWFRDQLADYVSSMVSVSARSMRPYVKRGWCERFVNSQRISGQQALDVSRLITLELVHRLFIDSAAPVARPIAANPNLVTHASRV